jgi:hypothetical protein
MGEPDEPETGKPQERHRPRTTKLRLAHPMASPARPLNCSLSDSTPSILSPPRALRHALVRLAVAR